MSYLKVECSAFRVLKDGNIFSKLSQLAMLADGIYVNVSLAHLLKNRGEEKRGRREGKGRAESAGEDGKKEKTWREGEDEKRRRRREGRRRRDREE